MAIVSFSFVFILLLQGATSQQYRWECSPLDSAANRYYLPDFDVNDIDYIYSNRSRLFPSTRGVTYIYPVNGSQLNCSGMVTGLEYCYLGSDSDLDKEVSVFILSTLVQNGSNLMVMDTVDVRSTPTSSKCREGFLRSQYCCDSTSLTLGDQFPLPPQNFAYGLTIQSEVYLLTWIGFRSPEFLVTQYIYSYNPMVGGVYTLDSNTLRTDRTHRLMRFLITPIQSSSVPPLPSTSMLTSSSVERGTSLPVAPSAGTSSIPLSSPQTNTMISPNPMTMVASPTPIFIQFSTTTIVSMILSTQQNDMLSTFVIETPPAVDSSTQVDTVVLSHTMSSTAVFVQNSMISSNPMMSTSYLSSVSDMPVSSSQQDILAFSSITPTPTAVTLAISDTTVFSTSPYMIISSIFSETLTMDNTITSSTPGNSIKFSRTLPRSPLFRSSNTILVSSLNQLGSTSVISVTTMVPLTTAISFEGSAISPSSSSNILFSDTTDTEVPKASTPMLDTVTSSSQQENTLFSSRISPSMTIVSPSSAVQGLGTSPVQLSSNVVSAPVDTTRTNSVFLISPSQSAASSIAASMTPASTIMALSSGISLSQQSNMISPSLETSTPIHIASTAAFSTAMSHITPTNTMDSGQQTSKRGLDVTTPIEDMMDTTGQILDAQSSSISYGLIGGVVGGVIALLVVVLAVIVTAAILMKKSRLKKWNPSRARSGTALVFSNAIYSGDETTRIDGNEKLVQKSSEYDYVKKSSEYDYAGIGPHVSDFPTAKRRLEDTLPRLPSEAKYESIDSKHPPGAINQTFYDSLLCDGSSAQYNPANTEDRIYVAPATDVSGLYAQLDEIMMDTDIVTRDNIKLGKLLGSGQFGDVYRGTWEHTAGDIEVAVKTLKKGAVKTDRVKFLQEAAIMGQFRHPNVVTMHGVVTDGEPVLLVLEMLKKGDLRQYLISMRLEDDCERISLDLDEHILLSFCRQIASGMAYLSNKAFVHRDLAARNVLVSGDGICKIADFGMSRDLADENYYISQGGKIPVKWTAPEALCYKKYSTSSDVWSYGTVLYEIWSVGHKPFEGIPNEKVLHMIESGYRLPPPPGCPRAVYVIMISCWALKVSDRPPFSKLCTELSYPDSKLLYWADEDKAVHSDATKLGSNLHCTNHLYKDLQLKFFPDYAEGLNDGYEDIVIHL